MAADGKIWVNSQLNKHCHVVLAGGVDAFKNTTSVDKVVDEHGGEWTCNNFKVKGKTKNLLLMKLVCKTVPKPLDPPESGTLTITVSPSPAVNPVPVTYVDEPNP